MSSSEYSTHQIAQIKVQARAECEAERARQQEIINSQASSISALVSLLLECGLSSDEIADRVAQKNRTLA